MRKVSSWLMALLLAASATQAAAQLPKCPGAYNASTWTNCVGETTLPSGKFRGAFRDGKPNGQGTWSNAKGDEYVGEFKDGKRHGRGTEYQANGIARSGFWENDVFKGR